MSNGRDSFDLDRFLGGGPAPTAGPPPPGGSSYRLPRQTQVIAFSRPRTGWLVAAAAAAGCGLLLALVGVLAGLPAWTAFVAWALAAPAAITLLAVYRRLDAREQAKPGYALPPGTRVLDVAVPVAVVLGSVVSSLGIAVWAGRL